MWRFSEYGEKTAAVDDAGNRITYKELEHMVSGFAGICGRTLVFHLCSNTIGSLAGYAAMLQAGVVPVMLAEDIDRELLDRLIHVYQPEYVWVSRHKRADFSDLAEVFSRYGYVLLKSDGASKEDLHDELALLLTTSGSTGSPKLVRQSYQNLKANTESIVQYLELEAGERPITTLPMNYTYGLSIINTHLYVGASMLLTDKAIMSRGFWEFLHKERATSFGGVPYTYEMLKKLRFFHMDIPSIRTMTQAGGKLTPELHREFAQFAQETNRKFVVMYGQTEATARMAYLPSEQALSKYGSMGIAIPGGRFELFDAKGNVIQDADTVGELVYYGENVTLGYAQTRSDLKLGDERGGMLVTGDMAKRDEDGYYYIVGRKKRFLKMYGKRVNLDEIERMLKDKYADADCACAGTDDHMYLFLDDPGILEEARDYIAQKTHIHITAVYAVYLKEIPKNNAGKTLYAHLQDYYE